MQKFVRSGLKIYKVLCTVTPEVLFSLTKPLAILLLTILFKLGVIINDNFI